MKDFLAEFIYEVSGRMIPGGLLVALYFHKAITDVLTTQKDLTTPILLGLAVCVWLVGMIIDLIMFVPAALFLGCACKIKRCPKWVKRMNEKLTGDAEPKPDEYYRRAMLKLCGEKVLLRGLFVVGVFVLVQPPTSLLLVPHFERITCGLMLLFACSWIFAVTRSNPHTIPQGRPANRGSSDE